MGKQGGFFEEVVYDSYSRVCDSNERLKEYLEGALSKAGLESFVTVMPRRDGYRIYTGEKPDAPFVYVDVYLDGDSVVVEGSSKRNLSESEMGDLARFLGISGKEAGEKLNKFRRFIDAFQKHAGEDVDKLEDLKVSDAVSDAVYVDAKNRNGGSPVRYMSGERLGRPVNHARPSGSGVTRGRDYVSKVDGGQRVGKPVQRAKVSDSKASDLSKISGALKLVKENFKVSGKPAEIKGITLDLKDLGGAIVSVKAYSKDKEPKITVEARTSDGKRRGFDYGIDAKASHVYGDLASLGKVEDSTPVRWLGGKRVSDASDKSTSTSSVSVSAPELKAALEAEAPSTLASSGNTSGPSISVEDEGDYFEVSMGGRGKAVTEAVRRVADKFGLSCTYSPGLSSTTSATYLLKPASAVSDGDTKISVSGDIDRSLWFDTISKRLHADSSFTVEDDTKDLVSGYYKLGDGNEGHISLYPDKIVFYSYENPSDADSDPYETVVPFDFYKKVESILALLWFVQATDDAYDFIDVVQSVKKANIGVSDSARVSDSEDTLPWFEKLSKYLRNDDGFTIVVDNDKFVSGYYKLGDGNDGFVSLHPDKIIFYAYEDPEDTDYPLEVIVPFNFYKRVEAIIALLNFAKGKYDAYNYVDFIRTMKNASREVSDQDHVSDSVYVSESGLTPEFIRPGVVNPYQDANWEKTSATLNWDWDGVDLMSIGQTIGYLGRRGKEVEKGRELYGIEYFSPNGKNHSISELIKEDYDRNLAQAKSFVEEHKDDPYYASSMKWVVDSSAAPRTDCIFPKDSPDVNDGKCHFPLNSLARGRAALAYASRYKELPAWYSGSMSLDEFVKHIADEVKKAYPSIEVTAAGEEAGAQTK